MTMQGSTLQNRPAAEMTVFRGTGLGGGPAEGRLFFPDRTAPEPRAEEPFRGEEAELAALDAALEQAAAELRRLKEGGGAAAEIFGVHEMLLDDPDFTEGVRGRIRSGIPAAAAAEQTGEQMAAVLAAMEDEYLRARAADLRDVAGRTARILRGETEPRLPAGGNGDAVILVCRELTPGDTALLDPKTTAGIVCEGGSATSHAAIIARSLGIPTVLRTGAISEEWDGEPALLDADAGELTVLPDEETTARFRRKKQEADAKKRRLEEVRHLPAVTPDGKEIRVYANIGGGAGEAPAAFEAGAGGIGLMRSEFLFLGRSRAPTEDEQYEAYRRVAEEARGKEVILRTLDIGADKTVPYLRQSGGENPALGLRGIRLCFAEPELFAAQLRAICRAARHGNLSVMLPMIVCADEIRQARKLLRAAAVAVGAERVPGVGIMLETPAAAVMARELAREADFFSVGTNDLCQYTFAADRQDPALAPLTEGEERLEPVFRLIRYAADCIHSAGKWIGVCGELAADTAFTARLLACGVDELSVSTASIAAIKAEIIG